MPRMRILTRHGVEDVELKTFEAGSAVGSYWNAVRHYLWTGRTDALDEFDGVEIKGRLLLTDPDLIERYARIGELDVDDIYEDAR
jgi:hypothetical protein